MKNNPEDARTILKQRDRFGRYVGIEIVEIGEGRAKVRMQVKDHHLNIVDTVHGGALFTLADMAIAAASNSRGQVAVLIQAAISYIQAAKGGILFAEAREISVGSRLGHYQITVTDDSGHALASFQGIVYRKKETLEDLFQSSASPTPES
ncbi:PaaI family thioesterase [bacterium]|nr:PaaI family thioesterase [bacterium]